METLTEEDLDWLTRVENRLASLRKRETKHRPNSMLISDFGDVIRQVRGLRIMLQARFGKQTDDILL